MAYPERTLQAIAEATERWLHGKGTKRDDILLVLSDGRWHGGAEFLGGNNIRNVWCSSYSQRIGDLIKMGVDIERDRHADNGLGRYRLVESESGRLF